MRELTIDGVKQSGNGTREPGTEALDVHTSINDVYLDIDAGRAAPKSVA